jgi:Histidine kinase
MFHQLHTKSQLLYWLKVFVLYALIEACIQLLLFFVLNTFGTERISNIEFHLVMWIFQCGLIWPIWWMAWLVRGKSILIQILVNVAFYFVYSYFWFGPVQDAIGYLYNNLQQLTRTESNRIAPPLDDGDSYSYLNYQLLKHAFRLSWFFLAAYFYNYRQEEKKRIELAIANKVLQLKMLKWHLNPSFYFNTLNHLQQVANEKPVNAAAPILQLAKVMEYVIYEAKEKQVDVKKEIEFLNSYIKLKNQQLINNSVFEIEVTGEHQKLTIAPLLLTGIIDEIVLAESITAKKYYVIQLQFDGNKMQLIIEGDLGQQNEMLIATGGTLDMRLKELYPERFSFYYLTDSPQGPAGYQFKLSLILDAER